MKATRHLALLASITSLAGFLALPATCRALPNPPITWSPTTGLTDAGDTDVVTTGSFVAAFNLGMTGVSATTVNGVTFAPFAVPNDFAAGTTTVGNYSLSFASRSSLNSGFGDSIAPFANLSSAYQTLLSAGVVDNGGGTITLTMGGLTNGQSYLFEWWSNDADLAATNAGNTTTATSTNSVTIKPNSNGTAGSPGQYATGTFTANADGQEVVTFNGSSSRPVLNGFELRTAVPEPSTAALGLLGAAAFTFRRPRKNRNHALPPSLRQRGVAAS